MWTDALELIERADRLHRQFFQVGHGRAKGPCWEPPIDVMETAERIHILVALPGVAPDEVEIVVDGGRVSVVGERTVGGPARARILRLEIPFGRFERTVELPAGAFEIEERKLEHGCLRLTLRKR